MRKKIEAWLPDRKRLVGMGILLTLAAVLLLHPTMAVYAAEFGSNTGSGDMPVVSMLDNLYLLIAGIISSVGSIVLLWGCSEMGLAMQNSEGGMQARSFGRIAGGLVMMLAPQIVAFLK